MRRRYLGARSGQGKRSGQTALPARRMGSAAVLGVLVAVLGAAASFVDKLKSLGWLWVSLVVVGALGGAAASVLASPWWQHRQDARARQAEVTARRARDQRDHFEPRGRGVMPFGGWRGWYFTGRTRALRELAGWLAAPRGGQPMVRVVTGGPGSGKSAVLGRLVLLADPVQRRVAVHAEPKLDATTLPPVGSIDLSVHAHGRTPEQVVESIADAAGVEAASVEDLLDALQGREEPLTVVVDALDEAVAAEELAGVLAQLTRTGGIRLLVGTRPHLVDRLTPLQAALDLDHSDYLVPGDVVAYVRRCLLLDADPDAPTPYRGRPDLAEQVAGAVAAQAGKSFLVAQVVSLALVDARQAVDVAEPSWREQFPHGLEQAMRAYLDGFGTSRSRVRDLLVPLAFAEGHGLADEGLWAMLAGELGTDEYKPHDVGWLLQDTSASNLLQRTELGDGTVAWRLFHEALAKYLRDNEVRYPAREVQRRVTRVLAERVPTRNGRREWLAADAYTRSHLVAHAAAASRLDELVGDPGVLLAAEPARLLRVLPTVTSPLGWSAARAYQQAAHQLTHDRPLGQRASCLQRAARYCGATELAERILGLGIALPWTTRWAHWQASGISRQLTGHSQGVQAVALGVVDGQPVIVSGSYDRTVRMWDARSGQPRGEPLTGHGQGVQAVALGDVDGQPVIVSGSEDGTVRMWDARSGQPRGEPLTGHSQHGGGGVRAVALGEVDGQPVIVSGGSDRLGRISDYAVQVWDARSGQPRGEQFATHIGQIHAIALGEVDGQPVIVVAGMSAVRVWDARSGQPHGEPFKGHRAQVQTMTLGQVDSQPVIITGGGDGTVRIWDARSGQPRGEPLNAHPGVVVVAVALGQVDGQPVIVSGGGGDHLVRLWDARSGQPRGEPLTGHTWVVQAVALGEVDGQPVIVSGSGDGTVRIWDARPGQPRRELLTGHSRGVGTVALGEVDGQPIIVSGGDDATVRVWDLHSGQPLGEPFKGHKVDIWTVALGEVDGQPIIVSGGYDGMVRVWDARSGQLRAEPVEIHASVNAVVLGQIDRQPVIISSGSEGTLQVWDARSGQPHGEPLASRLKPLRVLAFGEIDGQPVIVSGSHEGRIRVWDARSGQQPGEPLSGHTGTITAVSLGKLDGQQVIVSGGGDGTVRVWDVRSREQRGRPLTGHTGPVTAAEIAEFDGQPVIVSSGADGTVRVWDAQSGERCRIEVDAGTRDIVCTADGLIVAATALGLTAFQLAARG